MGRTTAIRETLYRAAILLLALAHIAERAARAPASRRRDAMAVLQVGEIAALGLLIDGFEPEIVRAYPHESTPHYAMLLACRFRALAWTIAWLTACGDLLEDAVPYARRQWASMFADLGDLPTSRQAPAHRLPRFLIDTS